MNIRVLKEIREYCVEQNETIINALNKIENNKKGIAIITDNKGKLCGVVTDGDIRRAMLRKNKIDITEKISSLIKNKDKPVTVKDTDSVSEMSKNLSDAITCIPIVDKNYRVCGLIRKRNDDEEFNIEGKRIGENESTFIISEIGMNHNGSFQIAKQLIDESAKIGVDSVKFQMRTLSSLYRGGKKIGANEDLNVQYTLGILNKFELSTKEMFKLFDYAREKNLIPICTPWDIESLDRLENYGISAYKIASADLTNHPLLIRVAKTSKPMIISTGMAEEIEIKESVEILKKIGANYSLLHCNSTYPAPFKDINLKYIERLKEIGECPVGYSGHERGINIAIAAVGLGAKIIEKHITIDKNMEGSDHKASLFPIEFFRMVEAIREVDKALGTKNNRKMSQGEIMNRSNLAKSLVAKKNINSGEIISEEMIDIKSPGRGLQPNKMKELIGSISKREINIGDFFYPSDLNSTSAISRNYKFKSKWGLTVRWHDMEKISENTNPDFLEFHLSYRDIDENYEEYFKNKKWSIDLKVHSPDVFAEDHLLDLSSLDQEYRNRSIAELQRVINLTKKIKPFFLQSTKPKIIASLGGVSSDNFLNQKQIAERYKILGESLKKLDCDGVEIIAQTLPPFPWYFGGQLYLNLFVEAENTIKFCEENNIRLCFDVSHSKLACNYYKKSFIDFYKKISKYVDHIHYGDARGIDGEGLQIGEGEIDFDELINNVKKLSPNATFIPEIWQGHNNNGEGFWIALEKLEYLYGKE